MNTKNIEENHFYFDEHLKKWKNLFLVLFVSIFLTTLLWIIYIRITEKKYSINATIVILDERKGEVENQQLQELNFLGPKKIVENEAEIIRSESLITSIVKKLQLQTPDKSIEETAEEINRNIFTEIPSKNSSIININFLYNDSAKGKKILYELIKGYDERNYSQRKKEADSLIAIIDSRINVVSNELNSLGSAEEIFKTNRNVTIPEQDARTFLEMRVDNQKKHDEAVVSFQNLEKLEQQIARNSGPDGIYLNLTNDQGLTALIQQLIQKESEKDILQRTTGRENPFLLTLEKQIADLHRSILSSIQLMKNNFQQTILLYSNQKELIGKNIQSLPKKDRKIQELSREKTILENLYSYLLQKREEAVITNIGIFSRMRIIDQPYASSKPAKPNKLISFSIFTLAGLIAGSLIAGFKSTLKPRIYNSKEVEKIIGLKTEGMIGSTKKKANNFNFGIKTLVNNLIQKKNLDRTTKISISAYSNSSGLLLGFELAKELNNLSQKTLLLIPSGFNFTYSSDRDNQVDVHYYNLDLMEIISSHSDENGSIYSFILIVLPQIIEMENNPDVIAICDTNLIFYTPEKYTIEQWSRIGFTLSSNPENRFKLILHNKN